MNEHQLTRLAEGIARHERTHGPTIHAHLGRHAPNLVECAIVNALLERNGLKSELYAGEREVAVPKDDPRPVQLHTREGADVVMNGEHLENR